MKDNTIYGFLSVKKDEKNIVTNINSYLEELSRVMSKLKTASILEARLPFQYKYIYFNLNKERGTFFEVFPNEDITGKFFFPDKPELAWLLKVIINKNHPMYKQTETEGFIQKVLDRSGRKYELVKESDEDM